MFWNNKNYANENYDLKDISSYAHGAGPRVDWMFNYKNESFDLTAPSKFVEEAHSVGLAVHPYIL